jgi:hypothetical protein
MLDLVNVTAMIKNDPEDAAAGTCRIEIVEPHNLAKHQPRGGYMLDNRQVQEASRFWSIFPLQTAENVVAIAQTNRRP